jgi:SAM-dependent methyltransferase
LLLSFVLTNHRFEILESLSEFLRTSCGGPEKLLSIGFGTGYELKVAHNLLRDWRYEAYDSSPESFQYASELLRFFGCPDAGLCKKLFPLEDGTLPEGLEGSFGKIVLCELLEHLENPERALRNVGRTLHRDGMIFATMAINIAQEDHIYHYRTVEEARTQVREAGLRVLHERVTPVTIMPFSERDREKIFTKGNYICFLGQN